MEPDPSGQPLSPRRGSDLLPAPQTPDSRERLRRLGRPGSSAGSTGRSWPQRVWKLASPCLSRSLQQPQREGSRDPTQGQRASLPPALCTLPPFQCQTGAATPGSLITWDLSRWPTGERVRGKAGEPDVTPLSPEKSASNKTLSCPGRPCEPVRDYSVGCVALYAASARPWGPSLRVLHKHKTQFRVLRPRGNGLPSWSFRPSHRLGGPSTRVMASRGLSAPRPLSRKRTSPSSL